MMYSIITTFVAVFTVGAKAMVRDLNFPRALSEPVWGTHVESGDGEELSEDERQIHFLSDQLELEREKTRRVIEHFQTYRLPADQDYRLRTELAEALRWGKDQQARADQAVSDLMSAQRALEKAQRWNRAQEQSFKAEFEKISIQKMKVIRQNEALAEELIKLKQKN